jgi:hypothetical protein
MARHTTYFELVAALGEPGCVLCRLATRSVREYFSALGYEQVNDVELRTALRAADGYCRRHAWLFLEQGGNRLGVAIIYRDLVQQARERLAAGGPRLSGGVGRSLGRLLGGGRGAAHRSTRAEAGCAACRVEAEAEARYRGTLLEHLGEAELRQRFAASSGLCQPHLARALASGGRGADRAWLEADAARRLDGLVAELDEYIRKHDYRFRQEGFGAEENAPQRAVERIVGWQVSESIESRARGRMSGPSFASRRWGERERRAEVQPPAEPERAPRDVRRAEPAEG